MEWIAILDEEFEQWLEAQEEDLQDEIIGRVNAISLAGPSARRDEKVGTIRDRKFKRLKEIIVQYKGDPWRIFFAFDPYRQMIVLLGGSKKGKNQARWYEDMKKEAIERYERHLKKARENNGKKTK